jgi:pimeloyl-ACP methyl ester carboxylesterase
MKNKINIFLGLLIICFLIPFQTFSMGAPPGGGGGPAICANKDFRSDNNLFQDIQNHEYINGLLRINFELQDSSADQSFYPRVNLYDSNCYHYGSDYYDYNNPPTVDFPAHTINFSLRFVSPTHFEIWNDDADAQFDCPLCNVDFGSFRYPDNLQAVFSVGDYYGYDHINSNSLPIKDPNFKAKTPVLIVPGLLGTEMEDGNTLLWADIIRMVNPLNNDSFMDPLSFNADLTPSDSNVFVSDVIKKLETALGLVNYNYADGLINEFTNQGYVENRDLFTFPYDWRYGVSGKYLDGTTNADLLAAKIQDILKQTGSDKVDIVAHSLGGLIVKEYAMEHPADNHIGKAVFVGVPNTGSLVAVKALIQGDNFGVLGLSDSEMKKISANLPASYDLLPSQEYYNNAGSFVSLIDNTADDSLGAFSVSENTKKTDLDYIQFKSFLTGEHSLNSQALANAENLHTPNFDNFDLRTAGIDLYAIDGCKTGTVSNFQEAKTKNILGQETTGYNSVGFNVGDGTVPLESATNLPISQGNKYYALVSEHGKMLSENGIRQEIVNLISGSSLDAGNNLITQDISKCQLNGKAISVFSPVNIFVTDQNGNRLGLADDGSIINEIPNADFEIMGDHKFIYLPQDEGEIYTINLTGTDTGTFTIKNQNIQNSQIASAEVFSDLPVTTALAGQININPADNTTTLSLNSSPSPILPDSTSTGQQVSDYVPPAPQPVATTGGGGLMPIPKTQNQNILPSQISLVQTVPPARQVILPPAKKPTPILKKTAKQIIQPKKIAAAIPEIKPAKAITIPIQPNPFLASLGSFGNSIMGFLNKLWLILKNKVK